MPTNTPTTTAIEDAIEAVIRRTMERYGIEYHVPPERNAPFATELATESYRQGRRDALEEIGCRWMPMYAPEVRKPCREREGEVEKVGVVVDEGQRLQLEERVFTFTRDACERCKLLAEIQAEGDERGDHHEDDRGGE